MKIEIKNFLYFLVFNIMFSIIFYLSDFRTTILCLMMVILNTFLMLALKNKNFDYALSLAKNFPNIKNVGYTKDKNKNKEYTKETKKYLKYLLNLLFLRNLKIAHYLFSSIFIALFLFTIIKPNTSFRNLAFFVLCEILINISFILIKKIDIILFTKYKDIKTIKLLNKFSKISESKSENIKFFIEKSDKRIAFEENLAFKDNKLASFFKISNKIEAYPYDKIPYLEENYEEILDKLHDLNRFLEIDSKKLNYINISQFELFTNEFLAFLDSCVKIDLENEYKEKLLIITKEYGNYLDTIIKGLKEDIKTNINIDYKVLKSLLEEASKTFQK